MNFSIHISRMTGKVLQPNEQVSFRYRLDQHTKKVVGLLATNGTEVSVSFLNGKDIEINSIETLLTQSMYLPPNRRILTWKQDLSKSSMITGSITNILPQSQTVSLYLITHKNNTHEK